jgi:hypothetical protein
MADHHIDRHDEHDRHGRDIIERLAAPLRAPESLDATFEVRLMTAVYAEPLPRRAAAPVAGAAPAWRAAWLTRPRTLRVSPLAGLAVAAGFAGIVAVGTASLVDDTTATTGRAVAASDARPTPPDSVTTVQFVLVAPHAARVALVGDFNDWDTRATPLATPAGRGVWTVSVPLATGRYQYAFVVNGREWVTDPGAPAVRDDDLGAASSVITVGASAT